MGGARQPKGGDAIMARHVQEARANGAEAGLELYQEYLDSPLGSKNPHVAEHRSKLKRLRSKSTRLGWYCKTFGVTEAPKANGRKGSTTPSGERLTRAQIIANGTVKVEKAKTTRSSKPKADEFNGLTAGVAWELLGSEEQFEPNDPNRPAYGMLNVLNAQARLAVLDEDGNIIWAP